MSARYGNWLRYTPGSLQKFNHSGIYTFVNNVQTLQGWKDSIEIQQIPQSIKTSEDRSGVDTVGYSSKISRSKALSYNSFSYSRTTTSYAVGQTTTRNLSGPYKGQYTIYTGAFGSDSYDITSAGTYLDSSIETSCKNEANLKVLVKIKEAKVNMAVAVAERMKTIDMIAERVRKIAQAMIDLRKGNLAGVAEGLGIAISNRGKKRIRSSIRRSTKGVSRSWLELQYGWKPLLSDIDGMTNYLASLDNIIVGRASASATRRITWSKRSALTGGYDLDFGYWDITYRYTVYYQAALPVIPNMTQLGLTNPLLIVWELVPYSFVVDWFLPIGNALEQLDATLGLKFNSGGYSSFKQTKRTRRRSTRTTSSTLDDESDKTYQFEGVYVNRTTLVSFPTAVLPTLKNPITLGHLANATALLRVAFRR